MPTTRTSTIVRTANGKANIPAGHAAYKCTRYGKVTFEAERRRISMRRTPAEED